MVYGTHVPAQRVPRAPRTMPRPPCWHSRSRPSRRPWLPFQDAAGAVALANLYRYVVAAKS
jgi:hypothetical protein